MTSRRHQAIQQVARNVEEILVASMAKDGHTQADRVLKDMDAQEQEQLETACRFILGVIEARR